MTKRRYELRILFTAASWAPLFTPDVRGAFTRGSRMHVEASPLVDRVDAVNLEEVPPAETQGRPSEGEAETERARALLLASRNSELTGEVESLRERLAETQGLLRRSEMTESLGGREREPRQDRGSTGPRRAPWRGGRSMKREDVVRRVVYGSEAGELDKIGWALLAMEAIDQAGASLELQGHIRLELERAGLLPDPSEEGAP